MIHYDDVILYNFQPQHLFHNTQQKIILFLKTLKLLKVNGTMRRIIDIIVGVSIMKRVLTTLFSRYFENKLTRFLQNISLSRLLGTKWSFSFAKTLVKYIDKIWVSPWVLFKMSMTTYKQEGYFYTMWGNIINQASNKQNELKWDAFNFTRNNLLVWIAFSQNIHWCPKLDATSPWTRVGQKIKVKKFRSNALKWLFSQ